MYASVLKPLVVGTETELVESDTGEPQKVTVKVTAEVGEIIDTSGWTGVQGYVEQGYLMLLPSDPDSLEKLAKAAREADKAAESDEADRRKRAKDALKKATKGRKKVKKTEATKADEADEDAEEVDDQTVDGSDESESENTGDVAEQGDELDDLTVKDLRQLAKKLGVSNYSSMSKDDIIDAIREADTQEG